MVFKRIAHSLPRLNMLNEPIVIGHPKQNAILTEILYRKKWRSWSAGVGNERPRRKWVSPQERGEYSIGDQN